MPLTTRVEELIGDRIGRLSHWDGPDVPIASPRDEDELMALLRAASEGGLRVLPIGNGTKLDQALVPERLDVAISTRRLSGITAFDPAEGVVTARAGTSMRVLRDAIEREGLHLSPEVARPDRATLGGVVGAASSGADRLAHGPLRDRVLGLRLALSDGRVVKSGGALVKDVAGYDLHKLVCGSHGSLGVAVEISLRLAPARASRVALRRRVDGPAAGVELCGRLRKLLPTARALRFDGEPERLWVTVDLEGRAAVVDEAVEVALGVLGEAHVLRGEGARRVGDELCDARREGGHWPHLALDALPGRFADVLDDVVAITTTNAPRIEGHPALGLAWLRFARPPGRETAHRVARVVAARGAAARWCGLPADLRAELVAAGAAPAGAAIMRRIRLALDPSETFAHPRLHPDL